MCVCIIVYFPSHTTKCLLSSTMNRLPMASALLPPNSIALLSSTEVKVNVLHGGGRSPVTSGELHVPEDTCTSVFE